jgi:Putative auto-transporter adhesin, head GIN domain
MTIKQSFVLLFTALTLFSCFRGRTITGSGNIVSEKRPLASFTGIDAESIVSVEVKNGPVAEVLVEADDNLQKYIYTKVKGDKLVIGMRRFTHFRNCTFKVYVTAPQLQNLSSSGSGSINTFGVLKDDKAITLSSSGAGRITAEVDAPAIEASVSGAGSITLDGRAKNYTAKVSGAGNIKSFNLLSENAEARISGAGNIDMHASVKLKVNVSGAGNVKYRGAAVVESNVSGAGKVTKE